MKKVSIIVPVYNSEKTIKRAIDSIVCQSYKNIELIIINDGSTDNSLDICMKCIEITKNTKLISIKNAGVSNARNLGIDNATGEYITFLDSDDYYEKNAVDIMMKTIDDSTELLIYGYNLTGDNGNIKKECTFNKTISLNQVKFREFSIHLVKNEMLNAPWNKLYKKALLDKSKARFPISFDIGEDLLFNLEVIKDVHNVILLNQTLLNYVYCKGQGLVSKFRKNRMETRLFIMNEVVEQYKYWNLNSCTITSAIHNMIVKDVFGYFMDFYKSQCLFNNKQKKHEIINVLTNSMVKKAAENVKEQSILFFLLRYILRTNNIPLILLCSRILSYKRGLR